MSEETSGPARSALPTDRHPDAALWREVRVGL